MVWSTSLIRSTIEKSMILHDFHSHRTHCGKTGLNGILMGTIINDIVKYDFERFLAILEHSA